MQFKFKRDGTVLYTNYSDETETLCRLIKQGSRWSVEGHPSVQSKTRWDAARQYLEVRDEPEVSALEAESQAQLRKPRPFRRERVFPVSMAEKVYDILIEECGATPNARARQDFVWSLTRTEYTSHEYRFCGNLGFGGKFYNSSDCIWVSCYQEDANVETRRMVAKANLRLAALYDEVFSAEVGG